MNNPNDYLEGKLEKFLIKKGIGGNRAVIISVCAIWGINILICLLCLYMIFIHQY